MDREAPPPSPGADTLTGVLSATVVVPTYNERDSLEGVARALLGLGQHVSVLVVDDSSPDGTGELADRLAAEDPRLTVLHRPGKQGLGAAYLAGFTLALDRGADVIVEFDADGSHRPEQLPALLAAIEAGADCAIGARWVPGGRVENWPLHRQLISKAGTRYARLMLRSRLHDITSGYRAFRASTLRAVRFDGLDSQGYCFQIELAWQVERAGGRIVEVPITFVERATGTSKMSVGIVVEAMLRVTQWGVAQRLGRMGVAAGTPR